MFSFRWRDWIHPSRQQITSILLLVASVAALLPMPLMPSASKNGKDHSRPFPCQNRPCGCRSADQCKKKCCCFSAEQKLAWANRNGVDASEVVACPQSSKTDAVTARKGCCSSHHIAKTQAANRLQKTATKAVRRSKVVIGVIAQHCHGVPHTLSGQPPFVVAPIISLTFSAEPTGERLICEGPRFAQLYAEPPVPPPRLVVA